MKRDIVLNPKRPLPEGREDNLREPSCPRGSRRLFYYVRGDGRAANKPRAK